MSEEYNYFESRQISTLVDLVLQMATDLHVVNARVRALEALLARQDTLPEGAVDTYRPSEDEAQRMDEVLTRFLGRLTRIIVEDGPAEHPLRSQWEDALSRKHE